MLIADCIRDFLERYPGGITTDQAVMWCLQQGCSFNTSDINKSVSGQLSKMKSRGEINAYSNGRYGYIWKRM